MNLAAGQVRQSRHPAASSSARSMRLFAWPRSPSRMKLWRESSAFTILRHHRVVVAHDAGEYRPPCAASRQGCRASRLYVPGKKTCSEKALWRSSPSVRGKLMKTPGRTAFIVCDYTPTELQDNCPTRLFSDGPARTDGIDGADFTPGTGHRALRYELRRRRMVSGDPSLDFLDKPAHGGGAAGRHW